MKRKVKESSIESLMISKVMVFLYTIILSYITIRTLSCNTLKYDLVMVMLGVLTLIGAYKFHSVLINSVIKEIEDIEDIEEKD